MTAVRRPSDNTHLAEYVVVSDWEVIEARAQPHGASAHAAESYALIRACTSRGQSGYYLH